MYAPTFYPSADQMGHWANLMIPYLGQGNHLWPGGIMICPSSLYNTRGYALSLNSALEPRQRSRGRQG
jgi:hypothetical protein